MIYFPRLTAELEMASVGTRDGGRTGKGQWVAEIGALIFFSEGEVELCSAAKSK